MEALPYNEVPKQPDAGHGTQ